MIFFFAPTLKPWRKRLKYKYMPVIIQPSQIKGIIQAPASKSSMQRACAAALLSKGTSFIQNPGYSNDDKVALDIIQRLGAGIKKENGGWQVVSNGVQPVSDEINCGESGLSIRMFTPLAALSDKEITIVGSGSLLKRPIDFFDEVLPQLGISVISNKGKLPLTIKGPLKPGNIEIDGSLSSQFLTGLIMAYSAAQPKSSPKGRTSEDSDNRSITIKVKNLKSKPYIDLTLDVMKQFGLSVPENKNYEEFIFHNDFSKSPPLGGGGASYNVEGDWSGGAFLLVAGAIAGAITVRGLNMMSAQGDKVIVEALMSANAGIAIEAKGIKVHPTAMKSFEFDASDCPDLFPPLVALAAFCKGETRLKGVHRLIHKESNRAKSLQEEFGKMGVRIDLEDDLMRIAGGDTIKGTRVHSHHDHRIAMACAVAALKAESETIIENAQAVNKSYPDFYWHLKKLGADVSLKNKINFYE